MPERSDYIQVHERMQQFREAYPAGSLQTEYHWDERDGEKWLVVKAYAYRDPEDTRPGIGHAWEPVPGRTPYTRGSELMVGETSAWGRALAALGIAVHKGIATGDEIRAAEGRSIERTKPSATDDDPWNAPPDTIPARRASGKQIQYIANLARKMNSGDPKETLALVNAALAMANLGSVKSSAELNDAQARHVIETFKEAQETQATALKLAEALEQQAVSVQPAEL